MERKTTENLTRGSEIYKTIPKGLIFIPSESQKEKTKNAVQNTIFEKVVAENFLDLVKGINLQVLEAW